MRPIHGGMLILCVALLIADRRSVRADDPLAAPAGWSQPGEGDVLQAFERVLEEAGIEDAAAFDTAAMSLGEALRSEDVDRLDAYLEAVASAWPEFEDHWHELRRRPESWVPEDLERLPQTLRPDVAAWVGRELSRRRLYDEALQWFAAADPMATVDPAAVLFFRGACHHALLNKDEALSDLRLLVKSEAIPERYARTARLMIADLSPLETDSLDEISRLMNDVSRRLSLGRANEPVQEREQAVIDKLDKMIEQMEQQRQQQQQQQQQQAGGGAQSPSGADQPMQDSEIAGGSGPGDVDPRDLGDRSGWGDLPPAEREEALQAISRDLPTHYREAIEAYFRKLATEDSGNR